MANIMETSFQDFISSRRGGLGKSAGGKVASPEIKAPEVQPIKQVAPLVTPPLAPPVTSAPVAPVSQPIIPRPDSIKAPVLQREEGAGKLSPLEELKRRRTARESQGIQTQPGQDPTELANKQAMLGVETGGRGLISNFISGLEKKTGISRQNPLIQAIPGIGSAVRAQTKLEQLGHGDLLEQTGIAFVQGQVDLVTFMGEAVQAAANIPAKRDNIIQGAILQALDPTKGGIDAVLDALNRSGLSPEDSLAQIVQVMTDPVLSKSKKLSEELDAAITNPLAKPIAFALDVAIPGIGASETKVIKKGVEAVKKTAQELTGAFGEKVVPLAKEGFKTAKVKAGEAVEAVGEKVVDIGKKRKGAKRDKKIEKIALDLDPSLGKKDVRKKVFVEGRAIEGKGEKQSRIMEGLLGTKKPKARSSRETLEIAETIEKRIPGAENMTKEKKFFEMNKEVKKTKQELRPEMQKVIIEDEHILNIEKNADEIKEQFLNHREYAAHAKDIIKERSRMQTYVDDIIKRIDNGEVVTADDIEDIRIAYDSSVSKQIKEYDLFSGTNERRGMFKELWIANRRMLNEMTDEIVSPHIGDLAKEKRKEMSNLIRGQENILSRTSKGSLEKQDVVKNPLITKERVATAGVSALVGSQLF